MIATRIDDDGLFRDRIADDRAVALERADGEGFADQLGFGGVHGGSWKNGWPILAQANCLGSVLREITKRLIFLL